MARQFFEANNQGPSVNSGYAIPYPAEMARMNELANRPDMKDTWTIEQQNRGFDASGQAAWASEFGSHLSSPGPGMQSMPGHPECV